jgi:3-methyl-2-oxobutanoate hydroxymethyltransferase
MTHSARPSDHDRRLYGGDPSRRVTLHDLARAKERGERWPMLTAYDAMTARLFDEAGIPVLLVGDSAANVVYGYDTTLPITMDELVPLVAAVTRSTRRALVVADMPFGTYQASPDQALGEAARFLKEGGAHAVKLEGGQRILPQVEALVGAGIPVMGHLGLTPAPRPKFVRAYADVRSIMADAVRAWSEDVVSGAYPAEEHSYE